VITLAIGHASLDSGTERETSNRNRRGVCDAAFFQWVYLIHAEYALDVLHMRYSLRQICRGRNLIG
jgi:hypothetical protein